MNEFYCRTNPTCLTCQIGLISPTFIYVSHLISHISCLVSHISCLKYEMV